MRVNVYAEEMTDRVELIEKTIDDTVYVGLRLYLELPSGTPGNHVSGPFMHKEDDDDSAAVTFWGKKDLRPVLQKMTGLLNGHYGNTLTTTLVFCICKLDESNDTEEVVVYDSAALARGDEPYGLEQYICDLLHGVLSQNCEYVYAKQTSEGVLLTDHGVRQRLTALGMTEMPELANRLDEVPYG